MSSFALFVRRLLWFLVLGACAAAAWWGWSAFQGGSVRFTSLLIEIDGEPRKILPGETIYLNPFNRVRVVDVGSTAPLGHGIRLHAPDMNVEELRHREMPLVDLLTDREPFAHYKFPVSAMRRDRPVGQVTWVVQPGVDDWLDRANRLINIDIRIGFLERALSLTSGDPSVKRRLLDDYKQAARWHRARELLKAMAAETPDTSLYAELLEIHEGLGDRNGMLSVLKILAEREPDRREWKTRLAELLEKSGRRLEAADQYEAMLEMSGEGDRLALLNRLGYLYTEEKKYSRAVSMYAEAVKLDQRDANLHYNLAFLYDRLGQADKAEFHLENAVTLESHDMDGRLTLALRLLDRGETRRAESYISEILKKSPDNLNALLMMSRIAESEGRKKELRSLYQRIHRLDPGNEAVIYNLGVLLYELGDYRESSEWLARYAGTHPEDVSVQELLFDSHVRTGNQDEAFVAAGRILDLKPSEIYPYHFIVDYLSGKGRYTQIAEMLEPAVKADPGAEVLKRYLMAAYIRVGKTDRALPLAEELLEKNPEDIALLGFLLDRYRAAGRTEAAVRIAETIVSVHPADDNAYDFLFDHLNRKEDHARVIKIMERGLRGSPDRGRLREYLVVAFLKTGDEERAVAHMEEIVRLRPDDAVMVLNLARLQEKRGKFAEALGAYEKAVILDPGNEEAAEGYLRTRLKRVGVE